MLGEHCVTKLHAQPKPCFLSTISNIFILAQGPIVHHTPEKLIFLDSIVNFEGIPFPPCPPMPIPACFKKLHVFLNPNNFSSSVSLHNYVQKVPLCNSIIFLLRFRLHSPLKSDSSKVPGCLCASLAPSSNRGHDGPGVDRGAQSGILLHPLSRCCAFHNAVWDVSSLGQICHTVDIVCYRLFLDAPQSPMRSEVGGDWITDV